MENRYEVYHFSSIASTNDFAKTLIPTRQNAIIYADEQFGGRGTKGRSFSSNKGGVYATKLNFYQNYHTKNAFEIMAKTAVAVCKTLEDYGLTACIKWPNDVYVSDKKICGILIENAFSGNQISYSIVGVGLNVCNHLPAELSEIAATMSSFMPVSPSVDEVRQTLFTHWEADFSMQDYLSRVGYLGQECTLLAGEQSHRAVLLSVDEEGGLHAMVGGEEKRFTSAEISIRIR